MNGTSSRFYHQTNFLRNPVGGTGGIGSSVTVSDGYMANARFEGACGGPSGDRACPHAPSQIICVGLSTGARWGRLGDAWNRLCRCRWMWAE